MDKTTAAKAIRKLAIQYEAMVSAADALDAIGSLEQIESETRSRVEALRKVEMQAIADAENARAVVLKTQDRLALEVADAVRKADELRIEAEESSKQAMAEAKRQVEYMKVSAYNQAEEMLADAKRRISEVNGERENASDALAQVVEKLAIKTAELEEITTRVEQAKDALRQFVRA